MLMWTVIKWTPQFIASDLYVIIEAVGFYAGASLQHDSGVEALHSSPLDVQPYFADATPLPYNNQPCSAVDDVDKTKVLGATHTHDVGGSSHTYEHVQADMDGGIDIDASRDVYEEFIDIDGVVDDAEVLDVPLIKNNEEDCPTTVPIPEWFTSNTWDNIKDPSPALDTGHLKSWHKGDHLAIGMLFKNKASVQLVLTLYSVKHNKQYKVIKSDTNRLVVWCIHKACLWSIRAICSKKHGLWQISKCMGPHSCSSFQVATNEWMMDSKFISIALKKYVREDLTRKGRDLHNPNTVTTLKCDPRAPGTCIFNSAFWAFGPCFRGFRHCRVVISIDVMHLYGKFKGKLLIAMATDGNNEVYPLAFAVVKSESTETWGWFLACLLTYVTDRTNLCIIPDKHRGIQSCFDDTTRGYLQPPLAHHWYCLRHLVINVNTNFNSVPLKNLVRKAVTANRVRKFENTMDCIKNVNPDAYDYLKDVD
ncbi:uncharacterized protein LOC112027857 [Quercus suber]|uniref:uncharacterized protein LOC112027857 n=1 Tax=Quercus suber TaxID=58331 RepID=UPI000CE2084C|nr:uncharacterized protein LOC112027857 [Quercus suber]